MVIIIIIIIIQISILVSQLALEEVSACMVPSTYSLPHCRFMCGYVCRCCRARISLVVTFEIEAHSEVLTQHEDFRFSMREWYDFMLKAVVSRV